MKKLANIFGDRVLSVLFWAAVGLSVAAILWRADFVFGDEQIFLRTICRGKWLPFSVFPATGRCYPLTHWDCNFVLLLPSALRAHVSELLYGANALVFVLTNLALAFLLMCESPTDAAERGFAFGVWLNFLVAPSVLLVSCWNIFPEQRMLLLVASFALGTFRSVERNSLGGSVLAVVSALLLLGYKETSFVLVATVAAVCLLGGRRRRNCRSRRMFLFLLVVSLLYVALYCGFIFAKVESSYQNGRKCGLLPAFLFYVRQPEIAAALVLSLVRFPFFLLGRSDRHLFWDALLFSGVAFSAAYVALQLIHGYRYYPSPSYAFLFPAFLHWLLFAARRFRHGEFLGIALLLAFFAYNVAVTVPIVLRHLERRRTEMNAIRTLVTACQPERIHYVQASDGAYDDYMRFVFGIFLEHAGWRGELKLSREKQVSLEADEAEVVPRGSCEASDSNALLTDWYAIFMGSCYRCDSAGLRLRAGDFGIEGAYPASFSTWSPWFGRMARVRFRIAPFVRGKPLGARLLAGAVTTPKHPENTLTVSADGVVLYSEKNCWPPRAHEFTIPAAQTDRESVILTIEAGRTICPADDGMSADTRNLGVCFESLDLRPVDGGCEGGDCQ